MLKPQDIEMEIGEGERYLQQGSAEQARAKFTLALTLLGQLIKSAKIAGTVGGPIAGASAAELIDGLMGGVDHPLLDLIVGGLLGGAVGRKVADMFGETLSPLLVRAYNGLGDAARMSGDDGEARRCYASALKARPDDPVTMSKMATVT